MQTVQITGGGSELELSGQDGEPARFHALWLRDNADDPQVRDPGSLQRRHTITELAPEVAIKRATLDGEHLSILFSDGIELRPSIGFLNQSRYDPGREKSAVDPATAWDGRLDPKASVASFPDVANDANQRREWLESFAVFGFARLADVPAQPDAILDVVKLFGFVRETNYGRVFDVRSKPLAENLAYTDLGLAPHTDNPYRDPVPTLQLLHCLENDTSGGETLLVDGFSAAEALRQASPEAFELLSNTLVQFSYRGDGVSDLQATRPIIETDCEGEITAVYFNNRSMVGPVAIEYERMPAFYSAYRALAEVIEHNSMQIRFSQSSGDLFMVDNRRVLHGRTAFDGSGSRWLQGTYADIDGLHSTLRLLQRS